MSIITDMKIKKPQIMGKLCRKIAKYLIKEYSKVNE